MRLVATRSVVVRPIATRGVVMPPIVTRCVVMLPSAAHGVVICSRSFKVPCPVLRACLAFELFWTTRILTDLHDVLPSFPLSSADTMLTLPHSLKLVWLMKDLYPKPVEGRGVHGNGENWDPMGWEWDGNGN